MFDYNLYFGNLKNINLDKDIDVLNSSSFDFIDLDKKFRSDYRRCFDKTSCFDSFVAQDKLFEIYEYFFNNYLFEFQVAHKFNHNFYNRQSRLKKRIDFMLSNFDCLFLTFTFRDDVLKSTTADTRRRYLTRVLRTLNCYCVGNVDYGSSDTYIDDNGNLRVATAREHYHCIVACDHIDNFNSSFWSYGGCNFEKIYFDVNSTVTATSKYLTKLTAHCVKKSTDFINNSIIYIKPKKNFKKVC